VLPTGLAVRIVKPSTTARLQAQFNTSRVKFIQTELQVALAMADVAQTRFLMGNVTDAHRAANLMKAARDSASEYLSGIQSAGLSDETKKWLDSAMDQLRLAVVDIERWERERAGKS
jgi:hypothetical protein